jgi:hypothetical protein
LLRFRRIADAARPVKDGVRAVGINVDLDPRLDEVRAQGLSGICSFSVRSDRSRTAIAGADLALLLHAQDLVEIEWAGR